MIVTALLATTAGCSDHAVAHTPDSSSSPAAPTAAPTASPGSPLVEPTAFPVTARPRIVAPTTRPVASTTTQGRLPEKRLVDANQASHDFAVAALTSDTTTDASPWDALRRATVWMSTDYADAALGEPPPSAPGAAWNTLAAHHGYTQVSATSADDDVPPDTATEVYREWVCTIRSLGRDHWVGPSETRVLFVHLRRVGRSWRVVGEQTQ